VRDDGDDRRASTLSPRLGKTSRQLAAVLEARDRGAGAKRSAELTPSPHRSEEVASDLSQPSPSAAEPSA